MYRLLLNKHEMVIIMTNYETHRKTSYMSEKHYDYKSQWREPKRESSEKKEDKKSNNQTKK